MAGKTPELKVMKREGTGKGAARAARRENLVPGVIYGGGEEPVTINVKYNELIKLLHAGHFMSTLIEVDVDGTKSRVICRGIQKDKVKDLPEHIDFLRLSRKSRINLNIPVEFVNEDECPGLTQGGVLTIVRNEIELKVTAGDIPESIVVDLTGLEIGDSITISNVKLPEGTRPMITDRDFAIASIAAPSALLSEEDESEDDETTEVIEQGETIAVDQDGDGEVQDGE
ncbi:50S ribosomal protein L25/general stress protein Ctc [Paracoccaceae bacterium GXU_MW_L88]